MDVAALVDSSILILDISSLVEDIKSGLPVGPLSSRNLALCLKGVPPRVFPCLLLMNRRVYAPGY